MAKRKEATFSEQDIEVPAELLAGLDAEELQEDEEWINEAMGARGGKRKKDAKGKPAAKPAAKKADKKKAPKKRGWGDEDDFSW